MNEMNETSTQVATATFQQSPLNEKNVNFTLGLQGIISSWFLLNCEEFLDDIFPKKSAHNVTVTHCILAFILYLISGKHFHGVSAVVEHVKTIPFAAFINKPDFLPEHMNRYVLTDTLKRIACYGSGKFVLKLISHMMSEEDRKSVSAAHIDSTSFRKYTGINPDKSYIALQYTDKKGNLDIEKVREFIKYALRQPLSDNDPVIKLNAFIEENLNTLTPKQFQEKLEEYNILDLLAMKFCLGYSRDHAPELPQICMLLVAVTLHDMAYPIFSETYSGNINDIHRMQLTSLHRIQQIKQTFPNMIYLVADSAACSLQNISLLRQQNLHLITRVPDQKSVAQKAMLAYSNGEITFSRMTVNGSNENEQEIEFAWLPVYTLSDNGNTTEVYKPMLVKAESLRPQKTLSIHKQAEQEEASLRASINRLSNYKKHSFACEADLKKAIEELSKKQHFCKITDWEILSFERNVGRGRPSAHSRKEIRFYAKAKVEQQQDIIDKAIEQELLYVLCSTDLDIDAKKLYETYHQQSCVEGCFKSLKSGDGFVGSRSLLKNPCHIQALYAVDTIALAISRIILGRIQRYFREHNKTFNRCDLPTTKLTWASLIGLTNVVAPVQINIRDSGGIAISGVDQSNPLFIDILNAMGPETWQFYKPEGYAGFEYVLFSQHYNEDPTMQPQQVA